jgi:hypothetical protein
MKLWLLTLTLILARGASMPACAQTADQSQSDDTDDQPSCKEPQTVDCVAHADKAELGIVFFNICVAPAREAEVRNEMERSLNCGKAESDITSFRSDGLVGLEAACEFPYPGWSTFFGRI